MISSEDIIHAQENIQSEIVKTPTVSSPVFSEKYGADVHLKLENLQTTGSFKLRGATNRIKSLSNSQRRKGVVAASSGNHAQGVALAATRLDTDSVIVMPESAPLTKQEATKKYGGTVITHGDDYQEARTYAQELHREKGLTYISTFDDWDVIAGQGTIGLEVLEDIPEPDVVIVPIGGGGLISGIAIAIKAKSPSTQIIGVEAMGASTVAESLHKGGIFELKSVDTVADGIAINSLGKKPLSVIQNYVDDVVTVDDRAIKDGIMTLLHDGKVLVEGAGAAPLAALEEQKIDYGKNDTVVPVLSGGNIDDSLIRSILNK